MLIRNPNHMDWANYNLDQLYQLAREAEYAYSHGSFTDQVKIGRTVRRIQVEIANRLFFTIVVLPNQVS